MVREDITTRDLRDLEAILQNNQKGITDIYQRYFPLILQLIITNSGNEDDAKDVFQETVIILYNKIQTGSFVLNSRLSTYIYAIAKRLWLKKLNQIGRMSSFNSLFDVEDNVLETFSIEQHNQNEENFKHIESALNELGEPCRAIIENYYYRSMPMSQIASKLGYVNADSVKAQKYKCIQRLKKIFFSKYKSM